MPRHRNTRPRQQKLKKSDGDIPGHRPVGARALKSAIDTLRPWLPESRVLDLYAGSGRFGLAALEEGAARVVFVERSAKLTEAIRRDVPAALSEKVEIAQLDALSHLATLSRNQEKFDLLFVDPPFDLWDETFASALARELQAIAAEQAILLVKYPARMVVFLRFQHLTPWKSVAFGESKLLYFRNE